jgi:hypothetical protein
MYHGNLCRVVNPAWEGFQSCPKRDVPRESFPLVQNTANIAVVREQPNPLWVWLFFYVQQKNIFYKIFFILNQYSTFVE